MKSLILIFAALFMIVNTSFATPPGLQGKDMPKGLSKQGKTPYGWSQGEKTGWANSHHHGNKHPKHHHPKHHHPKVHKSIKSKL